ncbi:MAG: DUF6152 family protein [Gammaproteobacteria bacterium]
MSHRVSISAFIVSVIGALGLPLSSKAHHSVAAGFDMAETITVVGTIQSMEWINPHARMFFEVETEDGEIQTWTAWYSSSNNLYRRGWRDGDLPVGATVTVSGFPARDGSFQLYGGDTLLPDGRTLFGGNAPGQR